MPRHSHDDLFRATGRGELAAVYYFFGSEEILKEEASRAIVDRALEPHERDFNLDQRSASDLDPEVLYALVNTLPMLAHRRAVVVRDAEHFRRKPALHQALVKYLENPSAETVLILVEAAPSGERQRDWEPDETLLVQAYAVDFQPLPADRVIRWIGHHAGRLGISFGEGAAEHLAAAVGYDLGALRAELEKLGSLPDPGEISLERVAELVGVRHGETLDDWVEAVLDDDTPRALRLTRGLLEQAGMSAVRMVTALGTALIGQRLARAHYDRGSRGDVLQRVLLERLRQVRPFGLGDWKVVTRSWSRRAEAWPGTRARAAIRACLAADISLKGTRISDEAGVVTDLVLKLTGGDGAARRPAERLETGTRRTAVRMTE
jgi:DNA polymerase-3 subunit delta